MIGVSMATALTSAKIKGVPLFKHLAVLSGKEVFYSFAVCSESFISQIDNNFPSPVHLPTIEMTSKWSKLKWIHCKVLNILTSFLCSIRVQKMENCCRFGFIITLIVLTSISVEVSWKIARGIASPSRRFHGLDSYRT